MLSGQTIPVPSLCVSTTVAINRLTPIPYAPDNTGYLAPFSPVKKSASFSLYLGPYLKIFPTSIDFFSTTLPPHFGQASLSPPERPESSGRAGLSLDISTFSAYSHSEQSIIVSSPTSDKTWNSWVKFSVNIPPPARV